MSARRFRRDARAMPPPIVSVVVFVVLTATAAVVRGAYAKNYHARDDAEATHRNVDSFRARSLLASPSPSRTWTDGGDDLATQCAASNARATCVLDALRANARAGAKDANRATCAAFETTRRILDSPSENGADRSTTLLKSCRAIARVIGSEAYAGASAESHVGACGSSAEVACDGGCADGAMEAFLAHYMASTPSPTVREGVERGYASCDDVERAMESACAHGVGWALGASAVRDAWTACDADGASADRVASCRAGVADGFVDNALGQDGAIDVGSVCSSADFGASGDVVAKEVSDACARALGAALLIKYDYDDVGSTEQCDLIASTRLKSKCVEAVNEEKTRKAILVAAAVPECETAMRTPVGQDAPPGTPPPPASPPPPLDREALDEKKEALRRHGTAVGGTLWLTCFMLLLTSVVVVTAYLHWRDAHGRSTVQYTMLSAELGAL